VATTQIIIDQLIEAHPRKSAVDVDAVMATLTALLVATLSDNGQPVDQPTDGPLVILVVGVNGAGKTTTIGKLAHRYLSEGQTVMLAAGDTFRAAAVEQLQAWGERNNVPVIAQHTGADSASVLFDALTAARARNVDVLLADTAGRLNNKAHLMEELEKIVRVIKKADPGAPHETLLVLDSGTGQNAVSQAREFDAAVGVTGIALTKLDGTAKGGVVFAIGQQTKRPIRYIGIGEGIEDLRPFDAREFVNALFSTTK
jgi:fused signal recognition particle receptor